MMTATFVLDTAPCGHEQRIPNEAYEHVVQLEPCPECGLPWRAQVIYGEERIPALKWGRPTRPEIADLVTRGEEGAAHEVMLAWQTTGPWLP